MEKYRNCDMLVIGGTLEGCAAALTAARKGKKVILIEKAGSLGGMSTNGLHALMERSPEEKFSKFRMEILDRLGLPSVEEDAVYPDQRLKVILGEMLRESGVEWYTHVFASTPSFDNNGRIIGFRANGKTEPFDINAGISVDATPLMETSGMCGIEEKEFTGLVSLSVKVNEFCISDLDLYDKTIVNGGIIGNLYCDYSEEKKDFSMSCRKPRVIIRPEAKEMIIEDLECIVPDSGILSISSAFMYLRGFAYSLRDYLRKTYGGMERLNIIHVAPFLSTYGTRTIDNVPDGLIYLNNDKNHYSNSGAIMKGIHSFAG